MAYEIMWKQIWIIWKNIGGLPQALVEKMEFDSPDSLLIDRPLNCKQWEVVYS